MANTVSTKFIGGPEPLFKAADAVKSKLQSLESVTSKGDLFNSFLGGNLAARAISELTSATISGGRAVLDYSASLQQSEIGFTSLIGNAESAKKHIQELQQFAKTTPFEFAGLVKNSQLLQGVGTDAKRIIPILTDVGNALSAAGKSQESVDRTVLALSQITSKQKLAGQEINQLAENGLSAVTILSQALGKPRAEIIKLSEAGQISSELFLESLHRFVQENNIGDAMEKQSHTFNGALSNIKDSLYITSSTAFKPLFDKVSNIADDISQELGKNEKGLQEVGVTIAKGISKGVGEVLSESLKNEINQAVKNSKEGKSSGLFSLVNANSQIGSSFYEGTIGKSIPELFEISNRLRKKDVTDITTDDLEDLKAINFFGKFDELIKKLEAEKADTTNKIIDAITFRSDDFVLFKDHKKDPLKIDGSGINKELQKLLDSTSKFNLSAVDNYLEYGKAKINSGAGSNLNKLREIAEFEQLAIKEKIRLQKEYFSSQVKNLTPEERSGGKGTELALQAVDSVNKLEYQAEILRLGTQKQAVDEVKKLQDDLRDSYVSLKSADNPFVKQMTDLEIVTERAQTRFGAFGDSVVKKIADIEKANLVKAIGLQTFENSFESLKFRQEAEKLAASPERQFADFKRALDRVEQKADSLSKIFNLDRKINEANFYASQYNPNNPKSFNESRFSFAERERFGYKGIEIFDALAEIKNLKTLSLEGTGDLGKGIIADKILEVIPKREDLLRQLQSPYSSTREDAQFLLNEQSIALSAKRQAERQKLSDFLEEQKTSEFGKKFAYEQISLINQNKDLTDIEKAKRRLSVTDALGNDLDPFLKRERIQDFYKAANEKDNQAVEALQISRDIKTLLGGIVEALISGGIKFDDSTINALKQSVSITLKNESNASAAIRQQSNTPRLKDTEDYYRIGNTHEAGKLYGATLLDP